ncbi:MAG: hypothetical protein RL368_1667 [Pseudomonadota bacterium]|jgi:tRNA(fMet)-specific endonuclease VapC
MNYLLDTCTISQFVRGNRGVLEKLKSTPPQQIRVSTITLMELEYGLNINPERAVKIRPILQVFLNAVEILPYFPEDAQATAHIRAILKTKGTPIGPYDLMLAGCAKQRNLIFVTDNTKEFQKIDGLVIENWVTRN